MVLSVAKYYYRDTDCYNSVPGFDRAQFCVTWSLASAPVFIGGVCKQTSSIVCSLLKMERCDYLFEQLLSIISPLRGKRLDTIMKLFTNLSKKRRCWRVQKHFWARCPKKHFTISSDFNYEKPVKALCLGLETSLPWLRSLELIGFRLQFSKGKFDKKKKLALKVEGVTWRSFNFNPV